MALRPDRTTVKTDISFFMNAVAERGGIVSHEVSAINPSGTSLDQSENTVNYVATALSGVKPVGMLMNDMVNLDLTRQHDNWHKDEIQLGGKVTVNEVGTFVTDRVYPGHSPLPGTLAYVGHSGFIAASDVATDQTDEDGSSRVVGRWLSRKDEDGFAKVAINLPNHG